RTAGSDHPGCDAVQSARTRERPDDGWRDPRRTPHHHRSLQTVSWHPYHFAADRVSVRKGLSVHEGSEPTVGKLFAPDLPALFSATAKGSVIEASRIEAVHALDVIPARRVPRGLSVARSQGIPAYRR